MFPKKIFQLLTQVQIYLKKYLEELKNILTKEKNNFWLLNFHYFYFTLFFFPNL